MGILTSLRKQQQALGRAILAAFSAATLSLALAPCAMSFPASDGLSGDPQAARHEVPQGSHRHDAGQANDHDDGQWCPHGAMPGAAHGLDADCATLPTLSTRVLKALKDIHPPFVPAFAIDHRWQPPTDAGGGSPSCNQRVLGVADHVFPPLNLLNCVFLD